jgi:hypothetical protein
LVGGGSDGDDEIHPFADDVFEFVGDFEVDGFPDDFHD